MDRSDFADLWDIYHPSQSSESEEEDELADVTPMLPTIDHLPDVVDYSTRAEGDWVVSGPTAPSGGNGRYFSSEIDAYRWAVAKYGQRRVTRIGVGNGRWGFLIRKV